VCNGHRQGFADWPRLACGYSGGTDAQQEAGCAKPLEQDQPGMPRALSGPSPCYHPVL